MLTFPFVAFVVPTIGRKTLKNALNSLIEQSDFDWNAFVVSDGIELDPSVRIDDPRIIYIKTSKKGKLGENHGNAGKVRNVALDHDQLRGEWIGFLDDDDTLLPDYVSNLRQEASNHNSDVIVTRMNHNGNIIPMPGMKDFQKNNVGISFAAKSHVFKKLGFRFRQTDAEDFELLNDFRSSGLLIMISDYVGYHVDGDFKETYRANIIKSDKKQCCVYVLCICIGLIVILGCFHQFQR